MREHPRAGFAGWVLVALAGIAVAVALSVAASNLSTQPIGISEEPLRATTRLAPAPDTGTQTTPRKQTHTTTSPATTTHTGPTRTPTEPTREGHEHEPDGDDD
jgi:hypothetical protein